MGVGVEVALGGAVDGPGLHAVEPGGHAGEGGRVPDEEALRAPRATVEEVEKEERG